MSCFFGEVTVKFRFEVLIQINFALGQEEKTGYLPVTDLAT